MNKTQTEIKIGKRIKELRGIQGISQEELSFRSGVHRTYIASLEVGNRNISISTLEKITNALLYFIIKVFPSEI